MTGSQRQVGTDYQSRRRVLATTGALGAGLLAGCLGDDSSPGGGGTSGSNDTPSGTGDTAGWQSIALEPVRGGESFTVESIEGPVVIQSFAVWCPKCERQSEQIANLDGSITPIGLNTDPNEDAAKVRQHAEDNGFDWRFAVAPQELTSSLIEAFGSTVANAPSTPVIVACDDGATQFFSGEINSAAQLEGAANDC